MTTDTKRLAERLRYTAQINLSRGLDEAHPWVGELNKAADALDAQAALLQEAAEVLRPFAAEAEHIAEHNPGWDYDGFPLRVGSRSSTLGPYRRARALLSRIEAMK